ncbi:MAG: transcriptional repressor, partial [Gammaproteobacteria bacterium]|nr:transcriptional repressor [Gammaproteobacteria bacterium]
QQRVEIAQILMSKPQHLCAEQVLEIVNQDRPKVSKATVYNTLGLFARKGLVQELIIDPTKVYYDSNTRHHHHFYNVDTGELVDINKEEVDVARLPNLPMGTIPDGVDVVVRVRKAS